MLVQNARDPKSCFDSTAGFTGRSHTASVGTKLQQWLAAWGRIHLCLFFATISFGVNCSLWTGQRNRLFPRDLPVGYEKTAQWILWVPSTRATSKRNLPKQLLLPSHPIPTHTGRACGERDNFPHPAVGLHTPLPPGPFISQTSLVFHTVPASPWSAGTGTLPARTPSQEQRSSNKNKQINQNQPTNRPNSNKINQIKPNKR